MSSASSFVDAPLLHIQRCLDSIAKQDTRAMVKHMVAVAEERTKCAIADKTIDVPRLHDLTHSVIAAKHDGKLVHFRGMVQDMQESEYFIGVHPAADDEDNKLHVSGLFADAPMLPNNFRLLELDAPHEHMQERNIYTCVALPGVNSWVSSSPSTTAPTNTPIDEMTRRLLRALPLAPPTMRHSVDHPVTMCNVKICANDVDIRMNDVLDMYGVLHVGGGEGEDAGNEENVSADLNVLSGDAMDTDEKKEARADMTPPMPTLHVTHVRRVACTNPLYDGECPMSEMSTERDRCLALLADVFAGDTLAAELALYAMIAKIPSRRGELDLPVGKLAVNISGVASDSNIARNCHTFLSLSVPNCHLLPITIASLNARRFAPRKDYALGVLVTGPLQLPAGTRLLIDETAMDEGKLGDTGVKNVSSLKELIERQSISYDFQYHTQYFHTDINVLILSLTQSMFGSDMHVKCSPRRPSQFDESSVDDPLRRYMDECRMGEAEIGEEIRKTMEQSFIDMRTADPKTSPDELHLRITLARLVAVSRGCAHVQLQDWRRAQSLCVLATSSVHQ